MKNTILCVEPRILFLREFLVLFELLARVIQLCMLHLYKNVSVIASIYKLRCIPVVRLQHAVHMVWNQTYGLLDVCCTRC